MTTESQIFSQPEERNVGHDGMSPALGHPGEVLEHPTMSVGEKRALLASWASDARAIPGLPMLRQLDDGSIVKLDAILRALKVLDDHQPKPVETRPALTWRTFYNRRARIGLSSGWLRRRSSDDDDDPPPCPAYGAIYPRRGSGGALADLEPALA